MDVGGFSSKTSFLMHDGTIKKAKHIKVNDELMSPSGRPTTINEINRVKKDMYTITSVKGTSYTVPEDHVLMLKVSSSGGVSWNNRQKAYIVEWLEGFSRKRKSFTEYAFGTREKAYKPAQKFLNKELPENENYTKNNDIVNITVKEYSKLSKRMRVLYKGFSSGIRFDEKDIEIDPYILGYWLGDGTSASTGITTAEPEVVEYFENFAKEHKLLFNKCSTKYVYRVSGSGRPGGNLFMNFLRESNLIYNKHIPDIYKFNSKENRLKLLAGLVDSDGHLERNNNCYDFVFKSEKLADDVIFLARSLGFKSFKRECQKTCTNSANGRVTGTYFRFGIYGKGLHRIPSILERKMASRRTQKKNASVTGITIAYAGRKDCYEFKFDSKKILLEDFTIVHK